MPFFAWLADVPRWVWLVLLAIPVLLLLAYGLWTAGMKVQQEREAAATRTELEAQQQLRQLRSKVSTRRPPPPPRPRRPLPRRPSRSLLRAGRCARRADRHPIRLQFDREDLGGGLPVRLGRARPERRPHRAPARSRRPRPAASWMKHTDYTIVAGENSAEPRARPSRCTCCAPPRCRRWSVYPPTITIGGTR